MSSEYDIEDLLTLVVSEHAESLGLNSGQAPVIRISSEAHAIEGPAISPENADSLLRSLAGTRQMREFRELGTAVFVYDFRDLARFQVQARLEKDEIQIDLRRLGPS